MKLASVKYLTGEGFKSVWANRLMSLASTGVLVACMVIIGLAILISENVNVAIGNLEQQNVVMAYMKDYSWALYGEEKAKTEDTSSTESSEEQADKNGIKESDYLIHNEKEAKALCDKIAALDNVAEVTYVSGEEGLESAKNNLPEGQEEYFVFLDEEYGNPLSGAAKIKMKDMALFEETIEEIKKFDEISNVSAQNDLANKLEALKKGIGVAGIFIISILIIISLVIVSNTIRVTMYNRKLEISIMKAVGATDAFVRIPFVVEGMLIGIVSAIISIGLLYFCYRVATETIIAQLETNEIVKYSEMILPLLAVFLGIGIVAGVLGSVIMISKYLKKEGSEFAAI